MGKSFSKFRRSKNRRSAEDDYVVVQNENRSSVGNNQQQAGVAHGATSTAADTVGGSADGGKLFMRAVCDFQATCPGDLSFRAVNILEVLNQQDEWWWKVRHFDTGEVGFASKHHLQSTDGQQAASLDCWFDIDRLESERLLRMPGLESGTYLLRPHQNRQADQSPQPPNLPSFTLTVRCSITHPNGTLGFAIRHYRVLPLENGTGFYVNPNRTFPTLADLLSHYQTEAEDRNMTLTRPCPRVFTPPPNFRDFEINRRQLELIEKVGSGSFGEVHRAKFGPVLEVAVKQMVQESVTVDSDFTIEARVMHGMHHPKIVQLIGVCTETEPVYIVTEYLPLGSLHQNLLKDREAKELTTSDMMNYLQQVADGMSYLEQRSYIHCDLRTANILMANRHIVKVADFGLSRLVESGYYRRNSAFPLRWSAPESISKKFFTIKSDVWSFGVVIFEVFSRGEKPYKSWRNAEVEERLVKGARMHVNLTDYGVEAAVADRLHQCMESCWNKTPKHRPTFIRLKHLFEDFAQEGESGYVEVVG